MSAYLYPRLPRPVARQLIRERFDTDRDLEHLRSVAATGHPAAAPAPTGGHPVPEAVLVEVAAAVREACADQWPTPADRGQGAALDRAIGRELVATMRILRPDAANDGVWSFLSVVLLPDIAALRFVERAENRLLGGARNVFRRTWERRMVLGELSDATGLNGQPLGEDELVNIFERSRLARSHELVRALAENILAWEGTDRSEYARELTRYVKRDLGAFNIDVLELEAVRAVVDAAAQRVRRT